MLDRNQDLEQHRDDPEEWEDKVERRPGRLASIVFSVRFARREIAEIRAAAARAGERTSEFVRVAALRRARGEASISVEMVPSTGAPSTGTIMFSKVGPSSEPALKAQYAEVA